jgi:hypothetical protein
MYKYDYFYQERQRLSIHPSYALHSFAVECGNMLKCGSKEQGIRVPSGKFPSWERYDLLMI